MTKLDIATPRKAHQSELEDITIAKAPLGHIGGPDPPHARKMRRLQSKKATWNPS